MNKSFLCLALLSILFFPKLELLAQEPDVKFGKVSLEELKMHSYQKDTFAGAVVLYNKGFFDDNLFNFTQFIRIKILKPSELNRANLVFHTPSKGDVSGFTYNLSASGEIIKEKLKASSIYVEEVIENYNILKVAMPNVKVGSVIDIKFTHVGLPYEWAFQKDIPVVWSELTINNNPNIFSFTKNHFGFEELYINKPSYWVAKDMPAIRPEPYMSSLENYVTKFEFNITGFKYFGVYQNIAADWDAVSRTLDKNEHFGVQLRAGGFLNKIADSIRSSSASDHEKIAIAKAHIQKNIHWNGGIRLLATEYLSHNYKKAWQGTSADLNLSLIILLKKIGFDAYPVALSTRDNGLLSPVFPSINKLNNVIAFVKLGDENLLVDASDKYAPPGLLPIRCLNLHGRVIDDKDNSWISLEPSHKYKKKVYSRISIMDDKTIQYQVGISHEGYSALEQRVNLDNIDYKKTRKSALETFHNVSISEYDITGKETLDKPLKESFILEQTVAGMGNYLLISPVFGQIFTQNPFFSEERKYPMDFIYPISESYTTNIELPEGYEVETMPESIAFTLPDNAGKLVYMLGRNNNIVQLNCSFEMNKFMYSPEQYQEMKRFLDLYISKTTSPIVLKKI